MSFDPAQHLSPARKNSPPDYLQVKWRVVWLRQDHPDAITAVEHVTISPEVAVFKATVSIPGGGSATDYGTETPRDFGDYIEKAATKALGRALAQLGYGTQFVGADLDDAPRAYGGDERADNPRIVDSPTPRPTTPQKPSQHARALVQEVATEYTLPDFWHDTKEAGYGDPKALAAFLGIDTFKGYAAADLLTMFNDKRKKESK